MDINQARNWKEKLYDTIIVDREIGSTSPFEQPLSIEGLFIAPSNPSLFDKFINFFWREGSINDLFEDVFIHTAFPNYDKIDWDVYSKLKLKGADKQDYFLYDKVSNLPLEIQSSKEQGELV